MSQPKYKIYPSALQKFQSFLEASEEFESDRNLVSESAKARGLYPGLSVGDYIESYEEVSARLEQELIDSVNRIPKGVLIAADKGSAMNECIDCMLLNVKSTRNDILLRSHLDEDTPYISALMNGNEFLFSYEACIALAQRLAGSIPQYLCSGILPTAYGDVELYGYVDYIKGDRIIDLKTTARYSFGKFATGWQKYLYPYCLTVSGDVVGIRDFEYLVAVWKERKDMPLSVELYSEVYTYNHEKATAKLREMCERFIEWLEYRREYIINKKIFALE